MSGSHVLAADFKIDYQNGTILIGDLPIGTKVVDPSWNWDFHLGIDYRNGLEVNSFDQFEVKSVIWIVVAKDHYAGLESHVSLHSVELIGEKAFDNNNRRGSCYGSSQWGEDEACISSILRYWLNSNGPYSALGFYQAFSENFKTAPLETTLPNREWKNGIAYSTIDKVFIPSATELGDSFHKGIYKIGEVYPFYVGEDWNKRVALHDKERCWYWTRTPEMSFSYAVRCVNDEGGFYDYIYNDEYLASYSHGGVRPALNLKSKTLVSEIRD